MKGHEDKGDPSARRRFSLFPKSLSQTLTQTLKPVYKKHGFAEHRILTEWHMIVGAECASYCLPQKLSLKNGGTLYVLAASARALELQHRQPLILQRIAGYFGYAAVARLVFTQTSSALFRKQRETAQKIVDNGDGRFEALAASCDDEQLRAALASLGRALAAVEK